MTPVAAWGGAGEPPSDAGTLARVSVDPSGLVKFWRDHYVRRFIPGGGSKVKWIVGTPGAGKSHALRMLEAAAAEDGLVTVALDAAVMPVRGIQEFGQAVLGALDTDGILSALSSRAVESMGYAPAEASPPESWLDWLVRERGRLRDSAVRDIREACERLVSALDLDLTLKVAVSLRLAELLGVLSPNPDDLAAWLKGYPLPKRVLKPLGLTQALHRHNARAILQGWAGLTQAAGFGGLLITVDRMEQLVARRDPGGAFVYYTRARRLETYEMIREFIDDGDTLPGLWLVLAARPELFDDAKSGVPSYPALKDRLSTEVDAAELNRFLDQVDWDQVFRADPAALTSLAEKWGALAGRPPVVAPPAGIESRVRRTVWATVSGGATPGGEPFGD